MSSPDTDPPAAPLDGIRAALVLLTRLPAGTRPIGPGGRRRAPVFFPLVGLCIGGIVAGTLMLLRPHLGAPVASLLALLAGILLTGALHEDGLADTADAWGGAGGDRQRLFAILKDSRHGTYGVLALVLSVALRWACLHQLDQAAPGALLLAATLSRTFLVWLMATMPYVTPAATASSGDAARATTDQAILASLLAAGLLAGLMVWDLWQPWAAAGAALVGALVTGLLAARFRRLAGGVTGDFLGATQQAAEISILAAMLAGG